MSSPTTSGTGQRKEKSAGLLKQLATPMIFETPDTDRQASLIAKLENGIKSLPKFDKAILFLGAVELTEIPEAGQEKALLDDAKLINLPSSYPEPSPSSHALATNLNGFELVQKSGAARDVVVNTLLTMNRARQIEYLRESGIVDDEWKILVEVHYYRDRVKTTSAFHKDTLGQTLFVNLNYDTQHRIAGPEYVLNPPVVEEHERQIERTLPAKFLSDLEQIRGELGEPTEIEASTIPANGVVAFVDEAIHHMTPHYGHRTVKGADLRKFLAKEYGEEIMQEAQAAYQAYTKYLSTLTGYFLSWIYTPSLDVSLLKKIPATDAAKWYNFMAICGQDDEEFTRQDLVNARMNTKEIDKMLAEHPNWKGFQNVSIPKAGSAPAVATPLKRQMSDRALAGDLPPEVTDKRRFFRTWVRILPKD